MNQPMRDMSVAGLLESVPAHGELLMQIELVFLQFEVLKAYFPFMSLNFHSI